MRKRAQLRVAARDGHIELSAEYTTPADEDGRQPNATVRLLPVAPSVRSS